MRKIKVFISSSEAELEHEREIASDVVNSLNLHPILFELSPSLSKSPYEGFLEEVKSCDLFILILWKSFSEAVKAEYLKALEKHKPILIFFKNLEYDEKRNLELESFIQELNEHTSWNTKVSTCQSFRSLKDLKTILKNSLANEISKFYKEPTHTLSREEMYELGTDIMLFARRRLYIFQRTPTLFLGLKNRYKENAYSSTSFSTYEKKFQEVLQDWIENHYQNQDVEFGYIFDAKLTKEEIHRYIASDKLSEQKLGEIKRQIDKYKDIEEKSSYRFRFTSLDTPISGPLIIGDNRYAIWILGSDDAISFSQENEKISTILARMIRTHCQNTKTSFQLFESIK